MGEMINEMINRAYFLIAFLFHFLKWVASHFDPSLLSSTLDVYIRVYSVACQFVLARRSRFGHLSDARRYGEMRALFSSKLSMRPIPRPS